MTAYDVAVENGEGTAGDTVRVDAGTKTQAKAAALAELPEGWVAKEATDASDHVND